MAIAWKGPEVASRQSYLRMRGIDARTGISADLHPNFYSVYKMSSLAHHCSMPLHLVHLGEEAVEPLISFLSVEYSSAQAFDGAPFLTSLRSLLRFAPDRCIASCCECLATKTSPPSARVP